MPRTRRAPVFAATLASVFAAWSAGCASPDAHGAIPDYAMRERVAAVAVGHSAAEARAILGDAPVRRPGHPTRPFPSPRRALTLSAPDVGAVRVEVYVVAARPAQGCPDVHFEDVPIAYVDGAVVGKGWEWVERHWRAWGGSLQALRGAQERRLCDAPAP